VFGEQLQSFPARGDVDGDGDAKVRGQSHLSPLRSASGDKTPCRANGLSMVNSYSNKRRGGI